MHPQFYEAETAVKCMCIQCSSQSRDLTSYNNIPSCATPNRPRGHPPISRSPLSAAAYRSADTPWFRHSTDWSCVCKPTLPLALKRCARTIYAIIIYADVRTLYSVHETSTQ